MTLTPEQLAKLESLCKQNPAGITYKNDPDYGSIEFYIGGTCLSTWCYEEAEDSFDEFKRVYYSGWLARQESLVVEQLESKPKLQVWYGKMPESNGKTNWTCQLHAGDWAEGFTIARSEYEDRVRYDADCLRYLIGEIKERPCILDYEGDKHSGYKD